MFSRAVGGRLKSDGESRILVQALDGVSFKLYPGDRLGVAGHNGSGKSTLLKVLAGIYEPDHGQVSVQGTVSSYLDLALGLSYDETGRQNIRTMLRMKGIRSRELEELLPAIVEFSGLAGYADLPIRIYSAGMISRLVFSTATALPAGVLIMDEWLSAGDADFAKSAAARMNAVFESSDVAILASHNGHLLHAMCNKLLVLGAGKVLYFGDSKDAPGSFA